MSIAKAYSAQLIGLKAELVTVEIDTSVGLHSFSIVGLVDKSIDEARDRISAAIKNSGYMSPKQKNQKLVISLAPAHVKKEGTSFDLAMAIAYLSASGSLVKTPENILLVGELSLTGKVRQVRGVLPIVCQSRSLGFDTVIIPEDNREEASLAKDITVIPVATLNEAIEYISGSRNIAPIATMFELGEPPYPKDIDIRMIKGNETAKRGLEIAAAGAHNIILHGPPGTGKTMLARCFPTLLPPLTYEQAIEVTGIHSVADISRASLIRHAPFRSPHHTASYPSIVGGGSMPRPGEITLAHRGVLFMDEFPEFDRKVIEALRQPLEDREITISRARGVISYPAQCILIASMNPCPCGKGKSKGCLCTPRMIENYWRRLSGPILDRMDIFLNVDKIDYDKLASFARPEYSSESSLDIRKRVIKARNTQRDRFAKFGISRFFNSEMNSQDIETCINAEPEATNSLLEYSKKLDLSARVFHRVLKVARTIADLGGEDAVRKAHIIEALQYREKKV